MLFTNVVAVGQMCQKLGLANCLAVQCNGCDFEHEFTTSNKTESWAFDVNTRIVYSMRSIGQGHSGIETFCTLMDMPKPLTKNNYKKIVDHIVPVVQDVANDTMRDAVNDLRRRNGNEETDVPLDIGVSCDGTWQRRGYASHNGIMNVLSIDVSCDGIWFV